MKRVLSGVMRKIFLKNTRIVNAAQSSEESITLQRLHTYWQERATSNISLSCWFKETSGGLRNWVWSHRRNGAWFGHYIALRSH